MIVNNLITMLVECYLNAYLKVTMTLVYNLNIFQIISSSARCGSNNKIKIRSDTTFLGDDWTFLGYNTSKSNVHGCSYGMRIEGLPI